MNILFVSHENVIFGASNSLLDLINQFKDKHNCIVVTRSSNGDMTKELQKRGIKTIPARYYTWEIYKDPNKFIDWTWLSHCIFWRLFGRVFDRIAASRIKSALDCNIDIIHVNSGVVDLGIFLKNALDAPLIWHLREFGTEDFYYKTYYPPSLFYHEMDKADGIITISDAITNKFRPHLTHAKVHRIYNGVGEDNIFKEKNYHEDESQKLIVLISGSKLTKAKGQDTAIEAMRILQNQNINNVELWIAGRGELKDMGIEKVPQNVKLLGHVDNLPAVRRDVDVELVCSRCEAFGRVTAEAMLGRIPVIGANTGGTPELISDGENGYIFPYGDAKTLANIIIEVNNRRSMLRELGVAAQKYAMTHFLIKRCADEIEDFYNEILEIKK